MPALFSTSGSLFRGLSQVAFMLFLLAPGAAQQTQTGAIRGEVRTAAGLPASGVRIAAMPAAQGDTLLLGIVETDGSGRYHIEGLPPGRYVIAAGLLDLPTYFPGVKGKAEARPIDVPSGTVVEGINFSLSQSTGVRVTGRIKGLPNPAPVGLIRMTLNPTTPQNSARAAESEVRSDGTFEFLKVSPGIYTVRSNPSHIFTDANGRASVETAQVEVSDKDVESPSFDFSGAVFGRVIVENGEALPTIKSLPAGITLINPASTLRLQARLVSTGLLNGVTTPVRASDGAFLALLVPGEYFIGADQIPIGYSITEISYGSVDLLKTPLKITNPPVPSNGEIRVTLSTKEKPEQPWHRIGGRVVGLSGSAEQLWVRIQGSIDPMQSSRQSTEQRTGEFPVRADGTFEIINVPPGAYALKVAGPSVIPDSPSIAVTVADSNIDGVEVAAGKPAPPRNSQPAASGHPAGLDLTALPKPTMPVRGVEVSGKVVISPANESSLMPTTIALFGSRFGPQSLETTIRGDGSFEFTNVEPGEYDVRPFPMAMPSASFPIRLETRELRGLEIQLPPQTDLGGKVSLEAGGPLPELKSMIMTLRGSDGRVDVPFSANGEVSVRLRQGNYTIAFSGIPSGYAVRSIVYQGSSMPPDALLKVAEPHHADVRIVLSAVR